MTPSPPTPAKETNDSQANEQEITEFSYELKIPKDRIAVLIGPKGKNKNELEEMTKTSINVDSREGDVRISGKDSIQLFLLKDIIKAIGRGFNPEIALRLFKQDYVLELLNLADYVKTKDQFIRIRGRVIGKEGKARERLEELTDTSMVVYGKTVAIIGFCDNVAICKRAAESLLEGSPHTSVYKWLERNQKQRKVDEMIGF